MKTIYDPPSGWKYGFPKAIPESVQSGEKTMRDWLLESGYPEEEIDFALKYGRRWYE